TGFLSCAVAGEAASTPIASARQQERSMGFSLHEPGGMGAAVGVSVADAFGQGQHASRLGIFSPLPAGERGDGSGHGTQLWAGVGGGGGGGGAQGPVVREGPPLTPAPSPRRGKGRRERPCNPAGGGAHSR